MFIIATKLKVGEQKNVTGKRQSVTFTNTQSWNVKQYP